MTLRVCSAAPRSSYSFRCPKCAEDVRKPADDHVVRLLLSGGVAATVEEVPAELLEPHDGPPLTYDDLLDLGLHLARTDRLAAFAGARVGS